MPPKIRANRANVTPEFIDVLLKMYGEWLTLNKRMITGNRGEIGTRLGMTAKRLLPIVRQQSPDLRNGFQYELTRLYRMPFTQFSVVMDVDPNNEYPGIPWLIGRTHHITATDYRNRNKIMGELGCYDVCIPSNAMRHPDLSHVHLVPVRNPLAEHRHYHHAGFRGSGTTVLSRSTGNCWGSYSGVIKGLLDDPDMPELFRQLHNHLCTYGDRPPYTRLDFDTTIKE